MSKQRGNRGAGRKRARELRRNATYPERSLWGLLRNRQLDGLKFRQQHPIGPYIVHFFCHEASLIIELDGESHVGRGTYDRGRQVYLEQRGYHVLRIGNDDVLDDMESVANAILRFCGRRIDDPKIP